MEINGAAAKMMCIYKQGLQRGVCWTPCGLPRGARGLGAGGWLPPLLSAALSLGCCLYLRLGLTQGGRGQAWKEELCSQD